MKKWLTSLAEIKLMSLILMMMNKTLNTCVTNWKIITPKDILNFVIPGHLAKMDCMIFPGWYFWLWETGWDLCGNWGMFGPPKYTFDCPHIQKSTFVIPGQISRIKVAQQHRIRYVRYLFKFWYRVIWGLRTALNWQIKVYFVQEIVYYACFVIPGHYGCPGGSLPKYSICRWD